MDAAIVTWVTEHLRHPFLDPVMIVITYLGEMGLLWIVIGLLMCISHSYRRFGVYLLLSLAVGCVIGEGLLKHLFGRIRPVDALQLTLLIPHPGGFSFPSGHSCSSFAAAISLRYANKRWGNCALILAFLIAFSRLYHGVHYLTDILAGAALGALVAILLYRILFRFLHPSSGAGPSV